MFRKLPRWVEVGSFWLAGIAGSVNAIGLLGFQHQSVSHLSGSAGLLGLSLVQGDGLGSLHLLLILLGFLLGAMLGGLILDDAVLRLGRRYSLALLLECALLLLAMAVLLRHSSAGHYLASAACGLQNAMVSTYSGAALRTTHVTGVFTDLGSLLGQRLRGRQLDRRRVLLYLLLIGGFIAGSALGAWAFRQWAVRALLLPAAGAFALALVYEWYRRRSGVAAR